MNLTSGASSSDDNPTSTLEERVNTPTLTPAVYHDKEKIIHMDGAIVNAVNWIEKCSP